MKVLEMKLIAYGPFTGVHMDLSAGQQGFHVIYGPNEAGKSSALKAMRHLLYGIPGQSPDDCQNETCASATVSRVKGSPWT